MPRQTQFQTQSPSTGISAENTTGIAGNGIPLTQTQNSSLVTPPQIPMVGHENGADTGGINPPIPAPVPFYRADANLRPIPNLSRSASIVADWIATNSAKAYR